MNKEKIFIISGEDSGDLHGAKLMASIKRANPKTEFFGIILLAASILIVIFARI